LNPPSRFGRVLLRCGQSFGKPGQSKNIMAKFARRVSHIPASALWAALAVYWCALTAALHYPLHLPPDSLALEGADKPVHFVLYGVLTLLLRLAIGRQSALSKILSTSRRRSLLTLLLVMLQGAVDEWTQPLTGRNADLTDLAYDLAGAACLLAWYHVALLRPASRSRPASPAYEF
jgi:VanZ family protein